MKKDEIKHIAKALVEVLDQVPAKDRESFFDQFAKYLFQTRKMKFRNLILKEIANLIEKKEKIVLARIVSAHPLSQDILAKLAQAFGATTFKVKIDPSVIAGVKIQVEDKVFDATVKRRLAAML